MAPVTSPSDERLERSLAWVLRIGVLVSASAVALGGALYLATHYDQPVSYRVQPEDSDDGLRTVPDVLAEVSHWRGRGIIQLGLLLLIATPVVRVACSAVGFAQQRDWTYVTMTLAVLGVLAYSLSFEGP